MFTPCPLTQAYFMRLDKTLWSSDQALLSIMDGVSEDLTSLSEQIPLMSSTIREVHLRAFAAIEIMYYRIPMYFVSGDTLGAYRIKLTSGYPPERSWRGLTEIAQQYTGLREPIIADRMERAIAGNLDTSAKQIGTLSETRRYSFYSAMINSCVILRRALRRNDVEHVPKIGVILDKICEEVGEPIRDRVSYLRLFLAINSNYAPRPWETDLWRI